VSLRSIGPSSVAPPHFAPAAAEGMPLEFEQVYSDHADLVFRNLRRMGLRPPTLDDAMQDVFLVVHRRLHEFEQRSALKTWIIGIALRVASDHLRRQKRQAARHEPLDADVSDLARKDPHELAAARQQAALLYAILAELDEAKRAVFILAEIEELSAPEIAQVVNANVNTVASRLKAARRKFAEVLRRERAKALWRQLP